MPPLPVARMRTCTSTSSPMVTLSSVLPLVSVYSRTTSRPSLIGAPGAVRSKPVWLAAYHAVPSLSFTRRRRGAAADHEPCSTLPLALPIDFTAPLAATSLMVSLDRSPAALVAQASSARMVMAEDSVL